MKTYISVLIFCLSGFGTLAQHPVRINFCESTLPLFSSGNENGSYSMGAGTNFFGKQFSSQLSQSIASPLYFSLSGSSMKGSIKFRDIISFEANYLYASIEFGLGYSFRPSNGWLYDLSYRNQQSLISYDTESSGALSSDYYTGVNQRHGVFLFATKPEKLAPLFGLGLSSLNVTEGLNELTFTGADLINGPSLDNDAYLLCPSIGLRAEISRRLIWTSTLSANIPLKNKDVFFSSVLLSTRLAIQWYRGEDKPD